MKRTAINQSWFPNRNMKKYEIKWECLVFPAFCPFTTRSMIQLSPQEYTQIPTTKIIKEVSFPTSHRLFLSWDNLWSEDGHIYSEKGWHSMDQYRVMDWFLMWSIWCCLWEKGPLERQAQLLFGCSHVSECPAVTLVLWNTHIGYFKVGCRIVLSRVCH